MMASCITWIRVSSILLLLTMKYGVVAILAPLFSLALSLFLSVVHDICWILFTEDIMIPLVDNRFVLQCMGFHHSSQEETHYPSAYDVKWDDGKNRKASPYLLSCWTTRFETSPHVELFDKVMDNRLANEASSKQNCALTNIAKITFGYPPGGGLSWTDSMLNFVGAIWDNKYDEYERSGWNRRLPRSTKKWQVARNVKSYLLWYEKILSALVHMADLTMWQSATATATSKSHGMESLSSSPIADNRSIPRSMVYGLRCISSSLNENSLLHNIDI